MFWPRPVTPPPTKLIWLVFRSEVQVRLSVQLVTTTTPPHEAAAGGDLLTFTGRCGPAGADDEEAGLLRAELPIGQGHNAVGIAFNVSLLLLPSSSSSASLPVWAGTCPSCVQS